MGTNHSSKDERQWEESEEPVLTPEHSGVDREPGCHAEVDIQMSSSDV